MYKLLLVLLLSGCATVPVSTIKVYRPPQTIAEFMAYKGRSDYKLGKVILSHK